MALDRITICAIETICVKHKWCKAADAWDQQTKLQLGRTIEGDRGMNRLESFTNWVEAKGDDPDAVLALRLITEWESAEHAPVLKDEGKASKSCLEIAVWKQRLWFGDLRQFQDWLKTKADDPKARLVLAWTADFEHKQMQKYLHECIQAFLGDPPDNDFRDGFLSALLLVAEEAAGLPMEASPFAEARELVYAGDD